MKKIPQLNIKKIKEKTSRMSLTLTLSIFVFIILIAAIGLAALGLWLLTMAGIMVDVNGDIKLGPAILFMSVISLILGGVPQKCRWCMLCHLLIAGEFFYLLCR